MKTDVITFPNPKFEAVVREAMNKPDGDIKKADAEKITSLEIPPLVRNLTGLEHFINLEELRCPGARVKELDVSAFTKLKALDCSRNLLTKLDVSANTKLKELYCSGNQLGELDLSANVELETLDCSSNRSYDTGVQLCDDLDLSANTKLRELKCLTGSYFNKAKLDISANTELRLLWCDARRMSLLDVSANTELKELGCDSNPPGIIFEFDIAALRGKTTEERQYYIARYGRED